MSRVLEATIENKTTSVTTHFREMNNREQYVYCLSYSLIYSHAAVFTSNVQFVHLAAGWPTQAGDATDQWCDRWNAPTVCPTQWRLPASAGWLSWIVDVDIASVKGHPKQRNGLDSSPGCLGATCPYMWPPNSQDLNLWTWRSHAAGTRVSVCVCARVCVCVLSMVAKTITATSKNV